MPLNKETKPYLCLNFISLSESVHIIHISTHINQFLNHTHQGVITIYFYAVIKTALFKSTLINEFSDLRVKKRDKNSLTRLEWGKTVIGNNRVRVCA